jgi:hypothetical protein
VARRTAFGQTSLPAEGLVKRHTLRAALGLALLAIGGASTGRAAEEGAAPLEQRIRSELEALIQETHKRPSAAEHERIVREASERGQGPSSAVSKAWLREELERSFLSFARSGALQDPAARYWLPFDPRVPRLVSQGPHGKLSRQGLEAFDFLMPVGTRVLVLYGTETSPLRGFALVDFEVGD